MKKEKEGFSLIELVIAMAIVAILTGLVALGTGLLGQADTRKMAESINSALSELKTENMSKTGPIYMHLFQYEGNYYIEINPVLSCTPSGDYGEVIGSTTSCTVALDDVQLMENTVWTFNISKKDGAFQVVSGTDLQSASTISVNNLAGNSPYNIVVVRDTGKHYIEQ